MSLSSYIKENQSNNTNNDFIRFVNESLANNTRIINEAQLLIDHGKDIDSLLYKTKKYFHNHIHNRINESYDDELTLNEQIAARDLMIYCLDDYKHVLLNQCSVYEGLLNDTMLITEAEFKLGEMISDLWKQGKDKVKEIYNDAKTKIAELNELIKEFVTKSFKSLKEFANKIIELIEDKLHSSLLKIANAIGFGEKRAAEVSDALIADVEENPGKFVQNDIYESLGREAKEYIINEGIVDIWNNSKIGKWYNSKKEKPLWNAFFQICNWLLVCKVLPAVVMVIWPGGFIYYFVSIAIKVVWNLNKIRGLIKQTKDFIHGWNTFTRGQKLWRGLTLLAVWGMWLWNCISIGMNCKEVFSKFTDALEDKGVWDTLFGKAHAGIEPDKFETWIAAFIKYIKKGISGEGWDFNAAKDEILDAFKEICEVTTETVEKAVDALGQTCTDEQLKDIVDKLKGTKITSAKQFMEEISKLTGHDSWAAAQDISGLDADKVYTFMMSGQFAPGTNGWSTAVVKTLGEDGFKVGDSVINQGLHAINPKGGGGTIMKFTGAAAKKLLDSGILGHKIDFACLGLSEAAQAAIQTTTEVVKSFSAAMASDVPIVTFKQKGNGFRIRLGESGSKNYVYDVKKNGVEIVKPTEIKNDKVRKAYDTIKKQLNEENKKYIDKILSSNLKADEKKKTEERIKEFNANYKSELEKTPLVIITGTKVSKEDQNKYDGVNESYISLGDYLIFEGIKTSIDSTIKGEELNDEKMLQNMEELKKVLLKRAKKAKNYEEIEQELNNVFGELGDGKTVATVAKNAATILRPFFKEFAKEDALKDNQYLYLFQNISTLMNRLLKKKDDDESRKKNIEDYNFIMSLLEKLELVQSTSNDNESDDKDNKSDDKEKTIKKDDKTEDDKDDKSDDKKKEESKEKEEEGEQPVLIFSLMYGMDIAWANSKGPRKEMYSLKGAFHSLEFIEIKKGMNKYDIQEMLGDWMFTMANNLCAITPVLPFEKKKNWWKDKFIPNKNLKENEERKDFGNLTNGELAEIMNNKDKAKDYVLVKTSNIPIIETDDDKKFVDNKKKEYTKTLSSVDDKETIELVKKADPSAVKDNKIKSDKIDGLADKLSQYKLSQKKSQENQKKGFWAKLKSFVKSLFGGDKEEGENYTALLKRIEKLEQKNVNKKDVKDDKNVSESLEEFDYYKFLNECFTPKTLKDYIYENIK